MVLSGGGGAGRHGRAGVKSPRRNGGRRGWWRRACARVSGRGRLSAAGDSFSSPARVRWPCMGGGGRGLPSVTFTAAGIVLIVPRLACSRADQSVSRVGRFQCPR